MLNAAFHSPANRSLGCSQVAPLFHPHSCNRFVSEFFEKRHHLTAGMRVDQPLLSSHELPALAERWHSRSARPFTSSHLASEQPHDVQVGSRLTPRPCTGRIGTPHRGDATLIVHTLTALLSLALMRTFGVYAQANVYFSPPGLEAAVHAHQDAQSVFIIQCEGRKRCRS